MQMLVVTNIWTIICNNNNNNKWSHNFNKRPHRNPEWIFHSGKNLMWHRPGASLPGILSDLLQQRRQAETAHAF